jgi:hypothetical protein
LTAAKRQALHSQVLSPGPNAGAAFGPLLTPALHPCRPIQIESTACAEAVTNGVKDICKGGDPVATITSMASTCASAMAEVQASSISGAEVKSGLAYPPKNVSKAAYTTACTSGCANGQVTAEAFARASACAFSTQTRVCYAVKTTLSGQASSQAFVSTNARAWSNACALGIGKASGQGEALAKTLVSVLARTFGDVVAKACSECDTCKCAPTAASLVYDSLKGASDTSAAAADGRFTMARAFSNAAATYCASDRSPKALQTSVQTAVSTLATMVADVYAKTTGSSSASGTALACSGGSVTTKIQVRGSEGGRAAAWVGGLLAGLCPDPKPNPSTHCIAPPPILAAARLPRTPS